MVLEEVLSSNTVANNNPYIIESKNICIDVSILYDISGNDESFIKLMVETFLRTMPDTIKKIEQSLSEQNWESVYQISHYAKSSLSIIKIGEMYNWIVQIETNAKNETDLYILPDLVKKVKDAFHHAEALLRSKFFGDTDTI